jgi:hypothetical protein
MSLGRLSFGKEGKYHLAGLLLKCATREPDRCGILMRKVCRVVVETQYLHHDSIKAVSKTGHRRLNDSDWSETSTLPTTSHTIFLVSSGDR